MLPEVTEMTDRAIAEETLTWLRKVGPALDALPGLVEQAGPVIDGIKTSPVLKMMGVRL